MLGWGWVWLRLGLCCGLCLCLRRQTRPEHTRGDQATAEQTRPGDTGPEYTTKAQTRPTCTHRRHPHRNNLLSSLVRVSSSSNLISLRPVIFGWRMRTKACLRCAALAATSEIRRSRHHGDLHRASHRPAPTLLTNKLGEEESRRQKRKGDKETKEKGGSGRQKRTKNNGNWIG